MQITQAPSTVITDAVKQDKKQPEKARRNGIAALDGVRAIAALLVLSFHLDQIAGVPWNLAHYPLLDATITMFGASGVELFFTLSGFLLFMPYAKALLFQGEWPSTRTFYLRRAFRIWPAYYFTLIMMILFFEPEYLRFAYWRRLALFLTFFMDSSPKTWQQLDGPFWTLAIEWQFYMLLPLIAFCFSLIVRRFSSSPLKRLKVLLLCCGGFFILELSVRYFGFYCQLYPEWSILVPRSVLNILLFFTFGVHGKFLEEFAFGMMVSACYVYAQHPDFGGAFKARLLRFSGWIWTLGIIVLVCAGLLLGGVIAYIPWLNNAAFLVPFWSAYPWLGEPVASFGYSLCILALLFGSNMLKWFFETRPLRWIGLISFGIYMWHQKLLLFFHENDLPFLPHRNPLLTNIEHWVWVGIIIIPLCYILYRTIEKPGIRLGTLLINFLFTRTVAEIIGAAFFYFA